MMRLRPLCGDRKASQEVGLRLNWANGHFLGQKMAKGQRFYMVLTTSNEFLRG